ncbi:hypothetical protein RJ639_040016 [Escallonia herrerae]|uniref:Fungal lipase-like domain-containing protein n=1 Tax=Escallonia herrerae TaxID=1293975 RepID=A0AA88WI28_9ASTE|nr:hypothetical protein RJ639_040016 [Escallonia herrerae]
MGLCPTSYGIPSSDRGDTPLVTGGDPPPSPATTPSPGLSSITTGPEPEISSLASPPSSPTAPSPTLGLGKRQKKALSVLKDYAAIRKGRQIVFTGHSSAGPTAIFATLHFLEENKKNRRQDKYSLPDFRIPTGWRSGSPTRSSSRKLGTLFRSFCYELVVVENSDTVVQMLLHLACDQAGEVAQVAYRSLKDNLVYESELQNSFKIRNVAYLDHAEGLPDDLGLCTFMPSFIERQLVFTSDIRSE